MSKLYASSPRLAAFFPFFLVLIVVVMSVIVVNYVTNSNLPAKAEKLAVAGCSVSYNGKTVDMCSAKPIETRAFIRLCNIPHLIFHDDAGGPGLHTEEGSSLGAVVMPGSTPGSFVIMNAKKTRKLCAYRVVPSRWKYPFSENGLTRPFDEMVADLSDTTAKCRLVWLDVSLNTDGNYYLVGTISEKHLIQEWEFKPTSKTSERFRIVVSTSRLGSEMKRYAGRELRPNWEVWLRDMNGARGDAPGVYYTPLQLDDFLTRGERGPPMIVVGSDNNWYAADGKTLRCSDDRTCDATSFNEFCLGFI